MTQLPVLTIYQSGFTLYFMVRGQVGGLNKIWNPTLSAGAGGWESYNSAHWAQYAIVMAEDTGSGVYLGVYPPNISATITSETIYVQGGGSPVIGDAPASGVGSSQGSNIAGLVGDAQPALNMARAQGLLQLGVLTGVPTSTVLPTNLTSSITDAYIGRIVAMASGNAYQAVAYVSAYDGTAKVLTLSSPLPAVPSAGDTFVII